jgi:hypothetical protein
MMRWSQMQHQTRPTSSRIFNYINLKEIHAPSSMPSSINGWCVAVSSKNIEISALESQSIKSGALNLARRLQIVCRRYQPAAITARCAITLIKLAR